MCFSSLCQSYLIKKRIKKRHHYLKLMFAFSSASSRLAIYNFPSQSSHFISFVLSKAWHSKAFSKCINNAGVVFKLVSPRRQNSWKLVCQWLIIAEQHVDPFEVQSQSTLDKVYWLCSGPTACSNQPGGQDLA